jgi:peptidoglycan/LPS O-acetylase OafA/YrhL
MAQTTVEEPTRLAYQPALDGVRAMAIIAVLLYHDALDQGVRGIARGGLLGVDAFFVLSGYLITTLLVLERKREGRIDYRQFWTRRARRLLPALMILLLGVAAYAAFVASPVERYDIRGQGLATLFYVQNWYVIFVEPATRTPLGHAWSLAIEEQWYFIWPPLLGYMLYRFRNRLEPVIVITIALTVASVLVMWLLYEPGGGRTRVYRGTDARAQALLVGAALALVLQWRGGPRRAWSRHVVELAGIAGALVFAYCVLRTSRNQYFLYRGGFLVVALAAGAVILAAIQPRSPVVRPVLAIPPLRWLGLISYGVYLYHLPIDVWLSEGRVGLSGTALFVLRTGVTLVLATVSYRYVEMPIRHGALPGRTGRIALVAAAATVVLALILSTTGGTRGTPRSRDEAAPVVAVPVAAGAGPGARA